MFDVITMLSVLFLMVGAFAVLNATINDHGVQPPVDDLPSHSPYAY